MSITRAERIALVTYARHGTAKQAAHALGKSQRTLEHQLASARERLNVATTIEAYRLVRDDGIGK